MHGLSVPRRRAGTAGGARSALRGALRSALAGAVRGGSEPSRRAVALAAVLVAALAVLAAAAGIPGRATYGAQVSGDEPHYLLTAISLGEDGGLDVSDEIAAQRFRPFHEVDLPRQAVTRPDGTRVVPHDPLLPVLLALPMRAGGWAGAKLALAALAGALAALTLWVAVRRFAVPLAVATLVTAVFAVSAPLAAYGHQVYPELPAALATIAAVAALTGRLGGRGLACLGVCVVALPWLAVKYVPVAATLAALGLRKAWKASRGRAAETGPETGPASSPASGSGGLRRSLAFAVVLALAGLAYALAHLAWYRGLTVYAAGDFFQAHGGQMSVLGTDPNVAGRARRLVGLLVGRSFGLAAWQPAWLLLVPAVVALGRARPPGWHHLLGPVAVAWLVATFVAVTMQGWWFPGRQVVVVLPLAVVLIGWWVSAAPVTARRRAALVAGLGGLGVWSYAWLATQASSGRLTWIVDFAETADPWYRAWRLVLPDYLSVTWWTWLLQGCWLGALALVAGWAWHRARTGPAREAGAGSGTGPGG